MSITTITLKQKTKTRLSDYKHGDRSYDEIINMLMDKVPLEDITEEHLQEHYRRLKDFKGVSKEEFKKRMKKHLTSDA